MKEGRTKEGEILEGIIYIYMFYEKGEIDKRLL